MSIVTRFAPSPTGALHRGHGFSALTAWRRAREAGGVFRLRLEDIDAGRCRPEFAAAIVEDLRWLGLDWDGEVRVQSAHLDEYAAALDKLAGRGLLYPCFCTRAEIARALSAPHGAVAVYPGTCRNLPAAERAARIGRGSPYALRLDLAAAAPGTALRFFEEGQGWVLAEPQRLGDVVLARKDSPASYHLCVVHDDALQGVTHVTRGADLAEATHIQVLLQHLLGLLTPVYAHHPLLCDEQGRRLAKREGAASLRALRASGACPDEVRRQLRAGA